MRRRISGKRPSSCPSTASTLSPSTRTSDSPAVTARSGAGMRIRTVMNISRLAGDHVAFNWIDPHALALGPGDRAIDLIVLAGNLQDDPAPESRHACPPDVRDNLEFLTEVVDHRLLHEIRWKRELDAPL